MKKGFLNFGIIMLIIAVAFVGYALNHPEASFPYGNKLAYPGYLLYIVIMILCFVMAKSKLK